MFRFLRIFLIGIILLISISPLTELTSSSQGSNSTNLIRVDVEERGNVIVLDYFITQTFNSNENRGIFLSLPKIQDGVWAQYTLTDAKRRFLDPEKIEPTAAVDFSNPEVFDNIPFEQESYQQIREWNQFRFRLGQPNKLLPSGVHQYQFRVEAEVSSAYQFDFTVLRDWEDPIGIVQVYVEGKDVCLEEIQCYSDAITLPQNNLLSPSPLVFRVLYSTWVYVIAWTIVYLIIFALWFAIARDPGSQYTVTKPLYEPPNNILPWHAQFLVADGKVYLRDTIMAYILWLYHKKYIVIEHTSVGNEVEMKVTLKKELPTGDKFLPPIFNRAVEKIAEKGFEKGLKSSKINSEQHGPLLHEVVFKYLKKYYINRPLYSVWGWSIAITALCFILTLILFNLLQEPFLIGDSWLPVVISTWVVSIPGLFILIRLWGKLSVDGYNLRNKVARFRHYLLRVEKYRLNFSNNPTTGIQHYLSIVPYAANFGFLESFQSYMKKLIPDGENVQMISSINSSVLHTALYAPTSESDSGFVSSVSSGGFSGGGGSW